MSTSLLPNQLSNALLQVRIAWGADLTVDSSLWTWTDVTADVMQDNGGTVSIIVGRGNEASVAQPATCTLRLKNQTGAYTPASPTAANYPNVRLGTPVQVRVSLNGGSVWFTRFQGEASSWSPGWDAQGRKAYVTLAASAKTRRLGSGSKPLKSALYRAITKSSVQPSAYWPCEDGADRVTVSQAVSPIAGVPPMLATGASNFAATAGAPGSDVQPNFSAGGLLTGVVPGTGAVTSWRVQCLVQVNAITSPNFASPIQWDTSDGNSWELLANTVGNGGLGYSDTLGNSFNSGVQIDDGQWHEVRATQTQSGGNIVLNVFLDGVLVINQTFAGTVSRVVKVYSNVAGNVQSIMSGVGHFAVWNNAISTPGLDTVDSMRGHAGESAGSRISRLCSEEGIALSSVGSALDLMGPQRIDTLMNLLRECESVDLGFLLDGLGPGLTYVCRSSIYNEAAQLTVDANSGQVPAAGPQPTHDDLRLLNRVTVTRTNGSFAVVEDTNGPLGTAKVGVFDNRVVVNTQTDGPLRDIGSWLVHLRTVDGMRYPQILLDLAAAPELAASWVGAIPTDRVDVTNLGNQLTQHPQGTVSVLAEGWTETLNARQWNVTASCSAFRPWEVFTIQDARLGRIDTDGSTLDSSLSSAGTSVQVASSVSVWDATATPFDVEIEGEQVTVAGIVNYLNANAFFESPQNVNNWSGVNGAAIAASGTQFHSGSQSLRITPNGVTSSPAAYADEVVVSAGVTYSYSAWVWVTAGITAVVGIQWNNSSHGFISDSTTSQALTAATWTQISGSGTAPAGAVFGQLHVGLAGVAAGSNLTYVDEAQLTNPLRQVFTLTRSVNGIVKAHSFGATLKLWRPGVLAL